MAAPAFTPPIAATDQGALSVERSGWFKLVLAIWAALYGLLIAVNLGVLSRPSFHDPDDQLRLQQVRDLLTGQSWFDLHQYRIDAAGGGVAMHWSRLVDVPIAAVMLIARPLLGQQGAEIAAQVIVPGLTLLAVLTLVGWIAARTLPRAAWPTALLAVAFAVPVIVQILPGRIDHHGWQIALALAAVAGLLVDDSRRGGWWTGTALAAWMAISFEGLPMAAWIVAALALAALADPGLRARLVATVQALAVASALLYAATRGLGELATRCDAIAPVHLVAFAWGAVAITAAQAWWPSSRMALVIGLGVAGAGALAIVAGAAPQCASGSFDMLDPVVRDLWYDNVKEGKPIWTAEPHLAAQYALPPLIGLLAAVWLAVRSSGKQRRWWALYALILAGALAIGLAVARAASVSGILATIPLGWLLAEGLGRLRRPANPLLRLAELAAAAAVIFAVLLPVVPVMGIEKLLDSTTRNPSPPASATACSARAARDAIAALPPGGILAPLDMGPDILVNTDRAVLATGHHRGARAMRVLIDAFSGSPGQARAIMAARGLRYLAVCDSVQELDLYRERAPDGMAARIGKGQVPAWLLPVPMPAASGFKLWKRLD